MEILARRERGRPSMLLTDRLARDDSVLSARRLMRSIESVSRVSVEFMQRLEVDRESRRPSAGGEVTYGDSKAGRLGQRWI